MATEYWIVKPSTKETYYLGKRLSHLDGIPNWIHKQKADYASWETVDDVFLDIFENSRYFLEGDMKLEQVFDICWSIYDWCDAPVYLDNDCNDDNLEWRDWKETCSVFDYLQSDEELLDTIVVNHIPKEYWVESDFVVDGFKTILNYITQTSIIKETEKIGEKS